MSQFTSPLKLAKTVYTDGQGRHLYRLMRDLEYEIGHEGSGLKIVVPKDRLTNLATVPRTPLLQWLYRGIADIEGPYIAASVLHDYLCNETFTADECDEPADRGERSGFSRLEAAAHFWVAMRALRTPLWQSFTAYVAVRANDWRLFFLQGCKFND